MPAYVIILAPAALPREAWRALLSNQPDLEVIGAVDGAAALAGLPKPRQPTAILMDLPAASAEIARQIREVSPDCGMLFLVQSYDLAEILALLQAGASGCLARHETVGDLARALIAAGRGEIVLPPQMAARALAVLARGKPLSETLIEPLSEREVEIVRLLAQGLTNKDIAQTLILSVRTVEAHLRSIFAKLGVRSRTEAALWAVKHGYGLQE